MPAARSAARRRAAAPSAKAKPGRRNPPPAAPQKGAVLKYGALSRRQKAALREYGELDPSPAPALPPPHSGCKRRRVVAETDLEAEDEEEEEERRDSERQEAAAAAAAATLQYGRRGDARSWAKPDAYGKLVKLLRKGSRNRELHDRRKREEEGLEEGSGGSSCGEDGDEEDEEGSGSSCGEEGDEEDEKGSGNSEEEGPGAASGENDEAKEHRGRHGEDAVLALDDEDEAAEGSADAEGNADDDELGETEAESVNEEDEVAGGDDDDDDDEEEAPEDGRSIATDTFECHSGDGRVLDMDERVAAVDRGAWKSVMYEDEALGQLTVMECLRQPEANHGAVDARAKVDWDELHVKKRLQKSWAKLAGPSQQGAQASGAVLDPLQRALFAHMNRYRDLSFADRNGGNSESIITAYCLHALNHVFKTRDRVLKNTSKISLAQAQDRDPGEIRDQGFTRPKVLILVPFKNGAKRVVDTIVALSGAEQVEQKKRFADEFGSPDEEKDPSKPADYWDTFAGNIDDHFRIGIKFTRKTLKLYSRFYASDILVASPLGLRMIIGSESDKKREYDFLSSIEVMILDQCEVFQMQNWQHVESIFDDMNQIPKEARDCDFSRVRGWYLDGRAAYLRQTLVFSGFRTPEINSLFNTRMKNVFGKVKTRREHEGSILDVVPRVKQVFTRIEPPSYAALDDFRFKHFTEKTLPALCHSSLSQSHTLIFIPSYFDFVRVRNHFLAEEISFGALSEYTSKGDMSRARGDFFHGRRKFLLVTERFHFFRRYKIRGARRVVFYAPPDHPQFYSEFVNFLALPLARGGRGGGGERAPEREHEDGLPSAGPAGAVGVIFSRFDRLRVERIVGSARVAKMTGDEKSVFVFV